MSIPPFTPFSAFNELRRRSFVRDTKAPTFGFELEGDPFLVRHASRRRAKAPRRVFTRHPHDQLTNRLRHRWSATEGFPAPKAQPNALTFHEITFYYSAKGA